VRNSSLGIKSNWKHFEMGLLNPESNFGRFSIYSYADNGAFLSTASTNDVAIPRAVTLSSNPAGNITSGTYTPAIVCTPGSVN
jgi:hypothetical protein